MTIKSDLAERIVDFIEVRNNYYDIRRTESPWKEVMEKWEKTYLEKGRWDEGARAANIEAIFDILDNYYIDPRG